MGEQSMHLKDNGNNSNNDQENHDENMSEDEAGEFNDITPEGMTYSYNTFFVIQLITEFAKLDNQLDELNSALDDIEQKNDDIHAKLLELLHANREIRQQLQTSNSSSPPDQNVPKQLKVYLN